MDRTRSAPASQPRTTTLSEPIDLQRSASDFGIWPATLAHESTGSDYALYSEHSLRVQQAHLQAIPETTVEYTPGDYVNTCIEASSPSVPFQNMRVQLTPQWCQSSDCSSTSPSTPQTALMTPVTQSSNSMSRQGSLNPSFLSPDDSSLRVVHQSSSDLFSTMPILPEDSQLSFQSSCFEHGSKFDPNFLSFTGPVASETVVFPAFSTSPSTSPLAVSNASVLNALACSPQQQPQNVSYLAEDMRRSTSSSSLSDSSSQHSTFSRQSRREREINAAAAASRPLAPKHSVSPPPTTTTSTPSTAQLAQIQTPDGLSKTVGLLSKTPYVRPSHPKIMCAHCSERPDGFRGTHELDRHIARAHAAVRKGFICVAPSFDAKFLDNCKHCRNKKVYGAYYNAAAHLRRAHFHPRKRGRKGKNDEKRGGIGGGDHPAMDWLKMHWIRELEVPNNKNAGEVDSADESAEDAEMANDAEGASFDGFGMQGIDRPYPAGQQHLPPAMPLDYGLGASIVSADAFAYPPVTDFSFDAYGMGP